MKDYEVFCQVAGYVIAEEETSLEDAFLHADLGECHDADGDNVDENTIKITGSYTTVVKASSPEEALTQAETNFENADFGDMQDVEHSPLQISEN